MNRLYQFGKFFCYVGEISGVTYLSLHYGWDVLIAAVAMSASAMIYLAICVEESK